jgi:hypothetical protein
LGQVVERFEEVVESWARGIGGRRMTEAEFGRRGSSVRVAAASRERKGRRQAKEERRRAMSWKGGAACEQRAALELGCG